MAEAAGFWSYVHADDHGERERVTRLADLLQAEYELLTGESLELFVDVEIEWGDDWRSRIEEALAGTTFFIPIITPRFFKSEECRRELVFYLNEAKSRGLEDLVLPILYVNVPGLNDPVPEDEVMALVAGRQWEDWTALRLKDEESEEYRKGINKLAQRLVDIGQRVESIPTSDRTFEAGLVSAGRATDEEEREGEEEPGYLELFLLIEETMPQLVGTVEALAPAIELLGTVASERAEELNRLDMRNAPMQTRLAAVRRLASSLESPADEVQRLGMVYASQLVKLDPAILAFFRALDEENVEEFPEELLEFVTGISGMAPAARGAGASLRGLIESMAPIARWSRDLRRPLKKVEGGLRTILDAQGILDQWEQQAHKWTPDGDPPR